MSLQHNMTKQTAIHLVIVVGQTLMPGLAILGVGTILLAVLSWYTGYTWIGMPPGGGCWP